MIMNEKLHIVAELIIVSAVILAIIFLSLPVYQKINNTNAYKANLSEYNTALDNYHVKLEQEKIDIKMHFIHVMSSPTSTLTTYERIANDAVDGLYSQTTYPSVNYSV